jgi:hypothetical protein
MPLKSLTLALVGLAAPLALTAAPYGRIPWEVPGRIEAEDYDKGGPGLGWSDTTPGNANPTGERYRNDDVDISFATNRYVVESSAGEWLHYTIDVPTAGAYRLTLQGVAPFAAAAVEISCAGSVVSFALPAVSNYTPTPFVSADTLQLPVGIHTLRLAITAGSPALDYLALTPTTLANQPPVVALTSTAPTFTSGQPLALTVNATDPDDTITKVEYYRSRTKIGEATTPPFAYTWPVALPGVHPLQALAYDQAGNIGRSAIITTTSTSPATYYVGAHVNNLAAEAPAAAATVRDSARVYMLNGIGGHPSDFATALDEAALIAAHPEIARGHFVSSGCSAGSYYFGRYTEDNPNQARTLAFFYEHPSLEWWKQYLPEGFQNLVQDYDGPVLIWGSAADGLSGTNGSLRAALYARRNQRPWTLLPSNYEGHCQPTSAVRQFGADWLAALSAQRIDHTLFLNGTPPTVVPLRPIDLSQGWIGEISTELGVGGASENNAYPESGPEFIDFLSPVPVHARLHAWDTSLYSAAPSADRVLTWLPNRLVAEAWYRLVTDGDAPAQLGSRFLRWKARHDLPLSTPATSDADQDGATLLQEYAFGLNPLAVDATPLARFEGSTTAPAIVYRYHSSDSTLTYTVEQSTDLVNWSPATGSEQILSTSGDYRTVRTTITNPLPGLKLFLRVRATLP